MPTWVLLAVALLGPMLAYGWCRTALAHYRTFADLLRSSVDLFRFNLLSALHYPLPVGVKEEREFWEMLDRLNVLFEIRAVRTSTRKRFEALRAKNPGTPFGWLSSFLQHRFALFALLYVAVPITATAGRGAVTHGWRTDARFLAVRELGTIIGSPAATW